MAEQLNLTGPRQVTRLGPHLGFRIDACQFVGDLRPVSRAWFCMNCCHSVITAVEP